MCRGGWLILGRAKRGRSTDLILRIVRNAAVAATPEYRLRADLPDRWRISSRAEANTASRGVSRVRRADVQARGRHSDALGHRSGLSNPLKISASRDAMHDPLVRHSTSACRDAQSDLRVRGRMVQDWVQSLPLVELLTRLDVDIHCNQ